MDFEVEMSIMLVNGFRGELFKWTKEENTKREKVENAVLSVFQSDTVQRRQNNIGWERKKNKRR